MLAWPTILIGRGDVPYDDLIYVIAVLILAALGAIFEKIKQGRARRREQPKPPPSPEARRPAPPARPAEPQRPAARPPVIRGAPEPQRPASPRPWGPPPPPRQPQPARRAVPAEPHRAQRPTPVKPVRPKAEPARAPVMPSVVLSGVDDTERLGAPVPATTPAAPAVGTLAAKTAEPAELVSGRILLGGLTVTDLRRAIVLNEVLGLPVSLRGPDHLWQQT